MTRTKRNAVLGLCRTAIKTTSATIVLTSACQVRQAETTQRKALSRSTWQRGAAQQIAPRPYKAFGAAIAALFDSEEERAIAKMSLVVDELAGTSSVHGATLRPKASARAKFVENDRNWLEFLAVTIARTRRGTYVAYSASLRTDGWRDHNALLALIELEKRTRQNWFGSDFAVLERFGDKACCFEDLKPYAVLEGSELSALQRDTEPTLCRSIDVHKLRRHVLGAEELSAAQETERALTYLSACTAAGAVRSSKHSQQLLSRVNMKMLYM
ncbi:hypothetical protein DFH11DRAFT_1882876 [Phellopilus nigrolimitatus]|nr:hypothetical protein DFH11DRAFT_1882876 [Phellopilus nigrolimitatus]